MDYMLQLDVDSALLGRPVTKCIWIDRIFYKCRSLCCQVTELSETTRGTGGFGSTGVTRSALSTSAVENTLKKPKVVLSLNWP